MTWRPLDDNADPGPRPLRDSLDALARRFGAPRAESVTTLFGKWAEVVGPTIAAHARPVRLRRGTLVVAADSPAWASELRFLSADLAARCNDVAGAGSVARLEVIVGRK